MPGLEVPVEVRQVPGEEAEEAEEAEEEEEKSSIKV